MKFNILVIAAAVSILIQPIFSFAADDSRGKSREGWNPPSVGPVVTWTAPVMRRGELDVQPFFFFNRTRGTFDEEGFYKSFTGKDKKWQWQEWLFLQYGILERLEIAAFGTAQQNIRQTDGKGAEGGGFGDSAMFLRCHVIDETDWIPYTTALFQIKVPTGKYQKPDDGKLGTDITGSIFTPGSYDYGFGVNLTKRIEPFMLHADFSYNIPCLTKIDGVKVRHGNYASFDCGAEYFFYRGFNLVFEFNWVTEGDKRFDGLLKPASDTVQMLLSPGFGWSNEKIQALVAYQRTIAGTNVDVDDSLVFTFVCVF